jgi:hypothetical protein
MKEKVMKTFNEFRQLSEKESEVEINLSEDEEYIYDEKEIRSACREEGMSELEINNFLEENFDEIEVDDEEDEEKE